MKKLNKKGFTLIELLAALVILTIIMGIAIPSISSSLERTTEKQNKSRIKVLESAAELYVTDHKNAVYNSLNENFDDECYIPISKLDISEDSKLNADDEPFNGAVVFKRSDLSYEYKENITGIRECK